ncbi:unnamed protein product [Protopolystoma xenopodis]|uniref:Uncharacterized protein n=1 Tax=Protopolystoma xenopodis TaxID=117903 RepID=A0A448WTD4_9PLAT|nr:unnamed protein product [Protopolystoma xenopodis]
MAKLTDDADYDAGETFENVSSPLSDAGHHDNYYGRLLRTRRNFGMDSSELRNREREPPHPIRQPLLSASCDANLRFPFIQLFCLTDLSLEMKSPVTITSSSPRIE